MSLTPEQTQLLQTYMAKNRNVPQGQPVQPVVLPQQSSGSGSGGALASLLHAAGSEFDTPNTPIQGPVQQGRPPLGAGTMPSQLTQFADRIDPAAAMQRQMIAQQQAAPKIDMQQIMKALAKAGFM